jgi:phospholipid/cholesterol/gamma-HCH transport system substrate-binding protein
MIRNRIGGSNGGTETAESVRVQGLVAAAPRPTARREVRVGFFVLAGFLSVVIALFTLTDVGLLRGRYNVTTVVPDAGGIRKGDPVQMRGVNIGRVRGFEIAPGGVAVLLELQREYPVPADSRVMLRSSGLLGGTVAEVVPGGAAETVRRGAVLPGESSTGLMEAADDLGSRADVVLGQMQALLSERTVDAVGTSAVELQRLLTELSALAAEQHRELSALSASLRRSAAGVERATAGPELANSVARLDAITQRLDVTVASLDRASGSLEAVLGRMERGEGTLGRLSADDELYVNLNRAAVNLNLLAEDIRANPRRYINVRVF